MDTDERITSIIMLLTLNKLISFRFNAYFIVLFSSEIKVFIGVSFNMPIPK
jgi:hypothetical protein